MTTLAPPSLLPPDSPVPDDVPIQIHRAVTRADAYSDWHLDPAA